MRQLDLVAPPTAPDREGIRLIHGDILESIALADGVGLVHADPPWTYSAGQPGHGRMDDHYSGLPVPTIVDHIEAAYEVAADDCYLVTWCTWPLLGEWTDVHRQMSWTYVSGAAWGKTGQIGTGYHWRGNSEPLLLYRKGKPKPRTTIRNYFSSPRNVFGDGCRHSEKPAPWLADIVQAFSDPGDEVLDLYAGMAPLARACLSAGRRYLGAEIDEQRHADAMALIAQWRGGEG